MRRWMIGLVLVMAAAGCTARGDQQPRTLLEEGRLYTSWLYGNEYQKLWDRFSPEMRQMIEEAKASGITRCPIRDVETKAAKCPVDLTFVKPEDAKAAVEELVRKGG